VTDQIRELTKTLKPFHTMDSFKVFIGKWFFISALIVLIANRTLPVRDDFSSIAYDWGFEAENALWILISFLSAVLFYFSTFPEKSNAKYLRIPTYFAMGGLFLLVFSRFDFQNPVQEIHTEMDVWRGGCGLFILIIAYLQSLFMVFWARKSAPSNPYATGIWAALSCSAVGCLLMQIVCARDSSAHIVLWHFVPMTIITLGGGLAARKILRW
jgi:hypothetical protein